jgi:hypothetical protein
VGTVEACLEYVFTDTIDIDAVSEVTWCWDKEVDRRDAVFTIEGVGAIFFLLNCVEVE